MGTRVLLGLDIIAAYPPWQREFPANYRPHDVHLQDTITTVVPPRAEFQARVARGDYPLWYSAPAGGIPLGAVPHSGMLSPLNLPYLLSPPWYAPALTKLLEMAVAATFTFLFLRSVGLAEVPSGFGAMAFMNSGFIVSMTNWPQAQVTSLIPFLFWATERGLRKGRMSAWWPVSLGATLLFLPGFPPLMGFAVLAAGGYVLARTFAASALTTARRMALPIMFGGAILLGTVMSAFQLLPFLSQMQDQNLEYREQNPTKHLSPRTLVTVVLPHAFGVGDNYFGQEERTRSSYHPTFYNEIQAFAGASTAVLIVVGIGNWRRRKRPDGVTSGVRAYLWTTTAIVVALMYSGGPLLSLAQEFFLFSTNYIGRLRSILGFLLAALAALSMHDLSRRREVERGGGRLWAPITWSLAALVAGLGAWVTLSAAAEAGQIRWVARHALIPISAGLVTLAVVVLTRRTGLAGRRLAMLSLPAVLMVESLAFVLPYWPRQARELFYPATSAHRFLDERTGSQFRYAGAGTAMFPAASTFFGLPTLTAKAFQDRRWVELVTTADTQSGGTRSYRFLRPDPTVASSPILDRMAVRYFVTEPHRDVFGKTRIVSRPTESDVALTPGLPLQWKVPADSVRALLVRLRGTSPDLDGFADLSVQLVGEDGRVLSKGRRRVDSRRGWFPVPVPEVRLGQDMRELTVRLELVARRGRVTLARDEDGHPATRLVVGSVDGFRTVFTEGVTVYERLSALPRIRWASRSVVIQSRVERIAAMAKGVSPDEVILSDPGPRGSDQKASLKLLEDSGDVIRVKVSAHGEGYLVVADPIQKDWRVTVDGRIAAVRAADQAMGAVLVPSGTHEIRFYYSPRSATRGLVISIIALLLLLLLALSDLLRHRHSSTGSAAAVR